MNRISLSMLTCAVVLSAACEPDKKEDVAPPSPSTAPAAPPPSASAPATSAAPAPSSSASSAPTSSAPAGKADHEPEAPLPPGDARFAVVTGKGTFLIDAPLEKIKGTSDEVRGHLDVNAKDLAKSTGTIMVRMSTLRTTTFGSKDKDVAQTEHARNWMEVGNDAPAASRMKYEWASFTVTSLDVTPASLADAKEEGGVRAVKAKVSGDFELHGATTKKTAEVTLRFKGPADAPTEIDLQTDAPMPVSMKAHTVMPRDTVGGFLNGALERIGKKIDDKVQVSFEATARTTMPAQP